MDYRSNSHRAVELNDIKHQGTAQTGSILLAKLQQKVARLEVTLRDKETEFLKVRSSLKNTHIHELKLQTEVYYQEILRLKNELNLLQETKLQGRHTSVEEPIERCSRTNAATVVHNKIDSQPPNESKTLIKSIDKLKDENERLSCQLSSIQVEKERLESDFDKILRQAKEQELKNKKKRNTYTEGMTQTSPKHDLSTIQSPEPAENALGDLRCQIEELHRKEKAWEEEKSMYRELILSLKEDRVFFKDTSQKRNDELWTLQKELVKLQKDIGGFQLNGKPLCKQCTKPSYRTVKSSKKIVVKEASTPNASQVSSQPSSSSSSSVSPGKPPKSKTSSVVSIKRLPTPQKNSRKESSRSTVSKSSLSSSSSSRSSSTQSSPSHLPTKKLSQSSTKPSSASSATSRSGENASGRCSEGGSIDRKSSTPSSASKRIPSLSSAASHSQGKVEPERKTPTSSCDSRKSPLLHTKTELDEDQDEEIAREILRDFDFSEVFNGHTSGCFTHDVLDETGNRDTLLPSAQSSPVPDGEIGQKTSDPEEEVPEDNGCGDSQEAEQDEVPSTSQKAKQDEVPSKSQKAKQDEVPTTSQKAKHDEVPTTSQKAKQDEIPITSQKAKQDEVPTTSQKAKQDEVPTTSQKAKQDEVPTTSQKAKQDEVPTTSQKAKQDEVPTTSQKAKQDEVPSTGSNEKLRDGAEALLTLLECHFIRKSKLETLKPKQTEKALQKAKSPTKRTSKISPSKSHTKSTASKSPSKVNTKPSVRSPAKSPPKLQRPVSTPKKSPSKPNTKATERVELKSGEEPQNLKDIDQMICLLESHVARNAFLSLKSGD